MAIKLTPIVESVMSSTAGKGITVGSIIGALILIVMLMFASLFDELSMELKLVMFTVVFVVTVGAAVYIFVIRKEPITLNPTTTETPTTPSQDATIIVKETRILAGIGTFERIKDDEHYPDGVWLSDILQSVYLEEVAMKNLPQIESTVDGYIVYAMGTLMKNVEYDPDRRVLLKVGSDDAFKGYWTKKDADYSLLKQNVIAAYQQDTGKKIYGNQYDEIILPYVQGKGYSEEQYVEYVEKKYGITFR